MSQAVPFVAAMYIHPVKSCRRVEVDHVVVSQYGVAGDREWQIQGPAAQLMTQRKFPEMARVQPTPMEGGLRLACDGLPDLEVRRPTEMNSRGKTMTGGVGVADAGDEAAAWLERALSVECRLTCIAPGYERRPLFGDEDVFGQDVTFVDAAPVHLVSASSYRYLLEHAAESFPIERFRPNLVVEGSEPWVEDTWQTLAIGDAELRVELPWPRCTMPQVDQDTGQRHNEPAVVLKRFRWCSEAPTLPEAVQSVMAGNALFGIAASIAPVDATITRGATVEVLATRTPLIAAPA